MSYEAIKTLPSYLAAVARAGSLNQIKTGTKLWFAPQAQDKQTIKSGIAYLRTLPPSERQDFAENFILASPAYQRADRVNLEHPAQNLLAPLLCVGIARVLPGEARDPFLMTHIPGSQALRDAFVFRVKDEMRSKKDIDHHIRHPDPAIAVKQTFQTATPGNWPRIAQLIMSNMPSETAGMAASLIRRAHNWLAQKEAVPDKDGLPIPYYRGTASVPHVHPGVEALHETADYREFRPVSQKTLVPAWVDAVEHRTFAALGPEWEGRGKGQKTARALYHTGYDPALLSG